MRRFIAFIILAISVMLGIGFATPGMMKNANLSLDYTTGREFVYTVEKKAEGDDMSIDSNEMNELVNNLSARLDSANVSRYQIIIEDSVDTVYSGESQIRVQVSADYDAKYEHIKRLMSFDSEFSLATSDSDGENILDGEKIFGTGKNRVKARVDYKKDDPRPYFVIPIKDDSSVRNTLTQMINHANSLGTTDDEGNINDAGKILLWSDFDSEVDNLSTAEEEKGKGNDEMYNRILCKFDPRDFYFNEDKTEISAMILDESAVNSSKYFAISSDLAKTYVDLFNARSIDLKLTFMFEQHINPLAESFISYGKPNTLSFSRTLIALCLALVLVAVFMIVFYKIQGLNAIINMLVTLFATFAIFNAVGMVFNVGALIGLIVISLLSLVSSVIYIEGFKNEIYRGRTMKKANQEANKKAFVPLIDAHLVVLLASLVIYFVGHSTIQSLAILGVTGSLISFVVNISLHRGFTWLLTNDTSLQKNTKLFGLNKNYIPDITKEEKQTYYGAFEKVDFTKKAKRNTLGTCIATGILALAMIGFGVFGNGVVNNSKGAEFTRAYYVLNEYGETIRDNNKKISIQYFEDNLSSVGIKYDSISLYENKDPEDTETTIYYYVVDFAKVVDLNKEIETKDGTKTLEDYMWSIINVDASEIDSLSFKNIRQVGRNPIIKVTQPAMTNILIATAIVIGMGAIYVAIRFGINKGLVTLGAGALSTFLPLGFFSLTRIEVVPATFVALIGIALINVLFTIIHASKAKEILSEKKNEDVSILDNSIRATSISATPLLATGVIAAYLALDFLAFGHPAFNTTFVALILGVLVSIMINLTMFTSAHLFLDKHIGSLNIHLPKRKAKEGKRKLGNIKGRKDSGEPEEALYPGIND
ncbi:MAG: hypothetical protein J1F31_04400 [Erysipelotrichales bacterium]|nr:hypothetical protein [Erysipelotrichales bacterium]